MSWQAPHTADASPRTPEGEGVPWGLGLGLSLAEALSEGDPVAQWVGDGRRLPRGTATK